MPVVKESTVQEVARGFTSDRNELTGGAENGISLEELEPVRRVRTTAVLIIVAVVFELSLLLIHSAQTDATQVALVLLAYMTGGFAFVWLLLTLRNVMNRRPSAMALSIIFGAAIVFRLTLLPLGAASSSDVFRYRWEGLVQAEGFNPYTTPPSDPALAVMAQEHSDVHSRVNHPSVPTIYPPVAQFLFWFNAVVFGGTLLGWKMILLVFDMLLALAGWKLLRAWRLPIWSLCFVLWCPLLVLETYEGGHLDLIGVSLIVLALLAKERSRPVLCGIALGLALNVKYPWPVLTLILLVARPGDLRRSVTTLMTAGVVAAICWIPYLPGLSTAISTLRMFSQYWRFNGTLFDLLRMLPGPAWLAPTLVATTLVSLAILLSRRPSHPLWTDVWLAFGAALLLMPVAFPWYFVWLVPALLAGPPRWVLVWISVVPFLHVVDWQYHVTGEWQQMRWLVILTGIVPAILLVLAWWRRIAEGRRANTVPLTSGDRHRENSGQIGR